MKITRIYADNKISNKQVIRTAVKNKPLSFKGEEDILAVTLKGIGMLGNSLVICPQVSLNQAGDAEEIKKKSEDIIAKSEKGLEKSEEVKETGYELLKESEEELGKSAIMRTIAVKKHKEGGEFYKEAVKICQTGENEKNKALYELKRVVFVINDMKKSINNIQDTKLSKQDGDCYREYDENTKRIKRETRFHENDFTIKQYNPDGTMDIITSRYDLSKVQYSQGFCRNKDGSTTVKRFCVYGYGVPEIIQNGIQIYDNGNMSIKEEFDYSEGEFIRKSDGVMVYESGNNITTTTKRAEYGYKDKKPISINKSLKIVTNNGNVVKEEVQRHFGYNKNGELIIIEEGCNIHTNLSDNKSVSHLDMKYVYDDSGIICIRKNTSINELNEMTVEKEYGYSRDGYKYVLKNGKTSGTQYGYKKGFKYNNDSLYQAEIDFESEIGKDVKCLKLFKYKDNELLSLSEGYRTQTDKGYGCNKYYGYKNDVLTDMMEGVNYFDDDTNIIKQLYSYDYDSEKISMMAEDYKLEHNGRLNYNKGYSFLNDRLYVYRSNYNQDANGNYIMGEYMYFPEENEN